MEYEAVIGLEVHVQLMTESKMFCPCSADYATAEPNTHVCPICLGMPGVLPTINQKALQYTVMTALALGCEIPEFSKFDRKNYPYPDLMKGYQISQYDMPMSQHGRVSLAADGIARTVGITRVHLEEDTARLLHRVDSLGQGYSLVDVNRAGVPLMEIVSEPDMRSPEEARQFLVSLRSILRYLGVSTGNMEEGALRCDANVSIRPRGTTGLGVKTEVKNMNSFRAVFRALEFEVNRQAQVLEAGGRVVQETRGWVEDKGITVSQRSKEYAHDYRYFPEPDLPPLVLAQEWVADVRARLPELPDQKRARFSADLGLPPADAAVLSENKEVAEFFEQTVAAGVPPRLAASWITVELFGLLRERGEEIGTCKVPPASMVELLQLLEKGTISGRIAKEVLAEMCQSGASAGQVVQARGLVQISDEQAIAEMVDRAMAENPRSVADYRGGKEQALSFLVGQVMKLSRGKANPALVNRLLRERL